MGFQHSSAVGPAEWIVCSGTVYVNDPAAELPIEQGIRSDLPQVTGRDLDPSFLGELHAILRGRTLAQMAEDFQKGDATKWETLRRVAYAVPIPNAYSIHLYVCSDDLCNLLAATEEARVADVIQRWRVLLHPSLQESPASESRRRSRAEVLPQLVALAREARSTGRKLMIRIEYRRHTRDATTGAVSGHEETRH